MTKNTTLMLFWNGKEIKILPTREDSQFSSRLCELFYNSVKFEWGIMTCSPSQAVCRVLTLLEMFWMESSSIKVEPISDHSTFYKRGTLWLHHVHSLQFDLNNFVFLACNRLLLQEEVDLKQDATKHTTVSSFINCPLALPSTVIMSLCG